MWLCWTSRCLKLLPLQRLQTEVEAAETRHVRRQAGLRSVGEHSGSPCRTRTGTLFPARDFKSPAYTIPPRGREASPYHHAARPRQVRQDARCNAVRTSLEGAGVHEVDALGGTGARRPTRRARSRRGSGRSARDRARLPRLRPLVGAQIVLCEAGGLLDSGGPRFGASGALDPFEDAAPCRGGNAFQFAGAGA